MKVGINFINVISFKGKREDRNTVSQLSKNNDYSLTENNRKRIDSAIENLAAESGESNVKFLIDTAKNLKYGTNIQTDIKPVYNWKEKLKNAAEKSLFASDPIVKNKLYPEFSKVFNTKKTLTSDELKILADRDKILKTIDRTQLENEKNLNIKDIENNLNYFIVSSETPLNQKKYILNRLLYFLSDDYKINPRLQGKKTLALAEMINDIALNTGKNSIPNTKAINQKQHGMCAAISIARKLMSYEYKDKYVDTILSELDDTDVIMTYDLSHPYEKRKVPVRKIYVDYDDALSKGYRIVDAATTNWMQIANMYGSENKIEKVYTPFDKLNFDTFNDSFYLPTIDNKEYAEKHLYYQALLAAKEKVDAVKTDKLLKTAKYIDKNSNLENDINLIKDLNYSVLKKLKTVYPRKTEHDLYDLTKKLLGLQVKYSDDFEYISDDTKKYHFLPNEEEEIKEQKIKNFVTEYYSKKFGSPDEAALKKNIKDIKDLLEFSVSISNSINTSGSIAKNTARDKKLFDAAAAYRTAAIFSLLDSDTLTDCMIRYDLPDAETMLLQKLAEAEKEAENGNEVYLKNISRIFGIPENKETVTDYMNELYNIVYGFLDKELDDLFYKLGMKSKNHVILNQLEDFKNRLGHGSKEILAMFSQTLKMKPDKKKFIEILSGYEKVLSQTPDYNNYVEALNILGYKSQLEVFTDAFNIVKDALEAPDEPLNAFIIKEYREANGFSDDTPLIDLKKQLEQISIAFNNISANLSGIRELLDIEDEKGNTINTANPNFYLIKAMEKEGKIIPADELQKLLDRYNAISKLRSADEFSSRHGQISDVSLYKYTASEKETLKKINKLVNFMYSDINKELADVFKTIRKPLEEYARKTGVRTGRYWVGPEGSSGMSTAQETRILQQLTDTPYKVVSDIKEAAEIIKKTPHSGISGSNVFHDRLGGHTQYIAEIAEKNGKEILFNDNTWGSSEHENIWTDSEGLMRTDYKDRRGGEKGYITDEKWRNGNYIDALSEKIGTITPENYSRKFLNKHRKINEEYKFPIYWETILPGKSEKADEIAGQINNKIFLPDSAYISTIENYAKTLSPQQIKNQKLKIDELRNSYLNELKQIKENIKETPFNSGIKTKSDLDSLPEDDLTRVSFEKAALTLSVDTGDRWKNIARAKTITELNGIRNQLRKDAREKFNYAFAKEPKILYAYALNNKKAHVIEIVDKALKNNDITLTEEEKTKIIYRTAVYTDEEKKLFDGSLAHTIDFLVNKLLKQFDAVVGDSENARKAKTEIERKLRKDVSDALYFNLKDIEKTAKINISIKNYIDRKYNPETNEEFVKIYRRLQDMTLEEFENETKDACDKDIDFKNYSGFDALRMYKSEKDEAKNALANIIYQKHLIDIFRLSETETAFKYKKLQKLPSFTKYKEERTFDDIYLTFRNSLYCLNYERMFNNAKDEAYRNYKLMPGYPKLEVLTESLIKEKIDPVCEMIDYTAASIHNNKLNLELYNLTDRLANLLDNIPDDRMLTNDEQRTLQLLTGTFLRSYMNDKSLKRSLAAAINLQKDSGCVPAGKIKELFAPWQKEAEALKKSNPYESAKQDADIAYKTTMKNIEYIINAEFSEKYRHIIKEDINKLFETAKKYQENPYDNAMAFRKLLSIIDRYASTQPGENEKFEFLNRLDTNLQDLKLLKYRLSAKNGRNCPEYQNIQKSGLIVAYEFLGQQDIEAFLEKLSKITETDDSTEEITLKQIVTFIKQRTGKTENELKDNSEILDLVYNISMYQNLKKTEKENEIAYINCQEDIKTISQDFLEKYIKPEYRTTTAQKIRDYAKSQLKIKDRQSEFNNLKNDYWYEKLLKDAKRYHILNFPDEVLERFLVLTSKCANLNNNTPERERALLEDELKRARVYLETGLSFSSVIAMQELLMEATDIGNPAIVSGRFKNYYTDLVDNITGMPLSMDDERALDYMVRSIMIEKNFDFAVNFIETLGLTDKFLKIESKILSVKNAKKIINKIADIRRTTSNQVEIFAQEMAKYDASCDNDANFVQKLENTKKNIIEKTSSMSRQENIMAMLNILENVQQTAAQYPELSKYSMLTDAINTILMTINDKANEAIEELNENLSIINHMNELIESLYVPENSDGYKYKQLFNKKYQQIRDYNNSIFLAAKMNR